MDDSVLTRFLTSRASPAQHLGDECSLLLIADWWKDVHGVDPAADIRGAYRNEAEKTQLIEARGGVLELVTALAASAGAADVPITEYPQRGDFAVVGVLGHDRQLGAIHSGGRLWALRTEAGIGFLRRLVVVRAWRI